jgi:hypothetical protein
VGIDYCWQRREEAPEMERERQQPVQQSEQSPARQPEKELSCSATQTHSLASQQPVTGCIEDARRRLRRLGQKEGNGVVHMGFALSDNCPKAFTSEKCFIMKGGWEMGMIGMVGDGIGACVRACSRHSRPKRESGLRAVRRPEAHSSPRARWTR